MYPSISVVDFDTDDGAGDGDAGRPVVNETNENSHWDEWGVGVAMVEVLT